MRRENICHQKISENINTENFIYPLYFCIVVAQVMGIVRVNTKISVYFLVSESKFGMHVYESERERTYNNPLRFLKSFSDSWK